MTDEGSKPETLPTGSTADGTQETPREGEEFWRGRARGLLDAVEMLEKCGSPHCQDMAMQMRALAVVAARVKPKTE